MDPLKPFLTVIAPGSRGQDPEQDRALVEATLLSNGALMDLGEGLIQPADFLDVLEFAGHDMDGTILIFEDNATRYNLW